MDPTAAWVALADAGPWAAALAVVLWLGYRITAQLIQGITTSAGLLAQALTRQAEALEKLGELEAEARVAHREQEIVLRALLQHREQRDGRDGG